MVVFSLVVMPDLEDYRAQAPPDQPIALATALRPLPAARDGRSPLLNLINRAKGSAHTPDAAVLRVPSVIALVTALKKKGSNHVFHR